MAAAAEVEVVLPGLFDYQRQFLAFRRRRRAFVAGIASGKTTTLCHDALKSAIEAPGYEGAIFFPTFRLWERVGLPTWEEIVPRDLAVYKRYEQRIYFANGSTALTLGLDRCRERVRGMNLAWALVDEVAVQRDAYALKLIGQRVRKGPPHLQHVSVFTSPYIFPWLKDWVEAKERKGRPVVDVMRATTYMNPTLSPDFIADLELDFPPGTPEHAQEMLGEFVSRTGYVYADTWKRTEHTTAWEGDDEAPYLLTVDPGFRASAWLVWQREPGTGAWVVVAEYLPEGELTEESARRVRRDRGRPPVRVLMDTPSLQSSRTHRNDDDAIQEVFGRGTSVEVLGGYERESDWRHKAVIAGLRSGRLRVARQLCPMHVRAGERGLVYALENCEWPDPAKRTERRDEKDPLKHVLDGLEFGAAVLTPPSLGRADDRRARLRR